MEEKKDLGKFGSFDERRYKQGTTDLISRLLRREISGNPEEIERLQKLLDKEREKLKQK